MATDDDPRAVSSDPLRVAHLPSGDQLVVRAAVPDDAEELLRLFDRLSPEDRQRRFFSMFRPDRAFVERMIALPDRDGLLLVAEILPADPAEERHIVGESGYSRRDDGDAELDITVDRTARGWVAPYLLDALTEQAAEHGIPNLRAEILLGNRPMLALVRARGCATVDTDDLSVVETTMATAGHVPSWPARGERPRVLVEIPGARWRASPALEAHGMDVIACGGPGARCAGHGCPMLVGDPCPLVEGADVVVFSLRHTDPQARALLDAHRRAGTHPLVIELRNGDRVVDAPAGAVVVDGPTIEDLSAVVERLLGGPVTLPVSSSSAS